MLLSRKCYLERSSGGNLECFLILLPCAICESPSVAILLISSNSRLLSRTSEEKHLKSLSSLYRVTNQHLRMSYSTRRSHGGFNKGSPIQKPVEVGKRYEVDVTEISRKGDGIAKVQGFVVFVENGKVGNKIRVEIKEVADRFAKATIVV
jgi:predicted RNA-binding protein with TRAM domain